MKTLHDIKKEKETKVGELITLCAIFFAFSNEQFTENKTPKKEGEKYLSLGAGAYMPKDNYPKWEQGIKDINKWYKAEIKAGKMRKEAIAYELANHEAYYTGEIEATLEALGSDYTEEEVREVYRTESKKNAEQYA